MKAYYSSNSTKYVCREVMSINFTGGVLTIIYKDPESGRVTTSQYSDESMPKESQINIH